MLTAHHFFSVLDSVENPATSHEGFAGLGAMDMNSGHQFLKSVTIIIALMLSFRAAPN